MFGFLLQKPQTTDVDSKKAREIFGKSGGDLTYDDIKYLLKHKLIGHSDGHHPYLSFKLDYGPLPEGHTYNIYDTKQKKYNKYKMRIAVSKQSRKTAYVLQGTRKFKLSFDKQI
jgi:hypothetical protein